MILWPTVDDERKIALAERARSWGADGLTTAGEAAASRAALTTPWRTFTLFPRLAMFLAAVIFVIAVFAFLDLLRIPLEGWITAAIAIGAAEVLIQKYRFFHCGVEEGLWLAALFAIIFGLPGHGREEVLLLFAAATLVAGIRVLNAGMMAGWLGFVVVYIAADGQFGNSGVEAAAWTALGLAAFAAGFFLRPLARPSLDLATTFVIVIGTLAGYLMLLFRNNPPGVDRHFSQGELVVLVLFLVWFAFASIRPRVHPSLFAALILLSGLLYESFVELRFSAETDLILGGALALVAAIAIDRGLRGSRDGVTSRPLTRRSDAAILEAAAAAAAAPLGHGGPGEKPPEEIGGGGKFGGGGATGGY